MKRRDATPEELEQYNELQNAAELARGAADQQFRRLRAECGQAVGMMLDPNSGAWYEPPQAAATRAQQKTAPAAAAGEGKANGTPAVQ